MWHQHHQLKDLIGCRGKISTNSPAEAQWRALSPGAVQSMGCQQLNNVVTSRLCRRYVGKPRDRNVDVSSLSIARIMLILKAGLFMRTTGYPGAILARGQIFWSVVLFHQLPTRSVQISNSRMSALQAFVAGIENHRMEAAVEPEEKRFQVPFFRPDGRNTIPAIQLLREDLVAHVGEMIQRLLIGFPPRHG
jgi:hypothetical protein